MSDTFYEDEAPHRELKPSTFDWSKYTGNIDWLKRNTIYITRSGSHSYGTSGPSSDIDYKGVCIAPKEWMLSFMPGEREFEQADKGWDGIDCSIYELRKYMLLATDNNPNVIELLFTDPTDWEVDSWAWQQIVKHRDLFLSRNCKNRFSGYAVSQLKRILTHRQWLLHPPDHQPTREEFNLPEFTAIPGDQLEAAKSQITKHLEAWELDWDLIEDKGARVAFKNQWVDTLAEMQLHSDNVYRAAGRKLGFDENFLEHLARERAYRSAVGQWKQYQTWLKERNPARAELEKKFGYDTKHGAHLVRLLRMAREILEGKGVIVKRPDADELKAIRFEGAWPFDKLVEWAKAQDGELEEIAQTSPLPRAPNRKLLAKLCVDVIDACTE